MDADGGFTRVFVSYHQMQVIGDDPLGDLPLGAVGDTLLSVQGEGLLTCFTGPHTGWVEVRVTLLDGPPDAADGWDAVSEADLWCPEGKVSVCGLMGDCPEPLRELAVPVSGLLRVQARARNRAEEPDENTEQHEIVVWPVDVGTGFRTLRWDGAGDIWKADPAGAASWSMLRMVTTANPPAHEKRLREVAGVPERPERRVDIRVDPRSGGVTLEDATIPVGPLEVRLRTVAPGVAEWTWTGDSGTAVPDTVATRVEAVDGMLVHRGVRGEHAVPLGLVWEHLLGGPPDAGPHPWQQVFAERAARAAAEAEHSRAARQRQLLRDWNGRLPSERLRTLRAHVRALVALDRDLPHLLEAAGPDRQRAVARWAARRACAVAGLDTVDWIAERIPAIDHDEPAFVDQRATWDRLFADERVPRTIVTNPHSGTPNCSQQAMALPALFAATDDDPLAAAVDALFAAAIAHGDAHHVLLTDVRSLL